MAWGDHEILYKQGFLPTSTLVLRRIIPQVVAMVCWWTWKTVAHIVVGTLRIQGVLVLTQVVASLLYPDPEQFCCLMFYLLKGYHFGRERCCFDMVWRRIYIGWTFAHTQTVRTPVHGQTLDMHDMNIR